MNNLRLEVGQSLPPKQDYFQQLASKVTVMGFNIEEIDSRRPWGGFIRVSKNQARKFIETFFAGVRLPDQAKGLDLSPKLLVVGPTEELSWQVHRRRSEFWRVLDGPVGAYLGSTDKLPTNSTTYHNGDTIDIPVATRHRLVGLDSLGMIAELWIHTDPNNPSDENDNRRIEDREEYISFRDSGRLDW